MRDGHGQINLAIMLFKLIALSAALSASPANANTAAYYRFGDDGWFYGDSSGNRNTLVQAGPQSAIEAGLVGVMPSVLPESGATNACSAQFAIGSGEVKVLQAADGSDFYSADFTVEAYVQPSVLSNQNIIAAQWNEGAANDRAWRLMLRKSNSDLLFQVSQDGSTPQTMTLPTGSLDQHKTYYVAASVETDPSGTDVVLYFQNLTGGGSLISQSFHLSSVTSVHDSEAPLTIGACLADDAIVTSSRFGGNIDELRLSRRALAQSQLLATAGLVYYVSPTGSDANSGAALNCPFKTVARAQQAVREQVTNSVNDVHVWLRGGTYVLNEPAVFNAGDGGVREQTVTYQAWADEEPLFCSDEPLSGWSVINSAGSLPAGCPTQAVGSLYWTDVSGIVAARSNLIASGKSILPHPRITELYDTVSGTKIPRSSTDGFEPETMYGTPVFLGGKRAGKLAYPEGVLTNHADITDAELHIVPSQDWTMNILPIEKVIESDRLAETAVRGRYALDNIKKWRLRPSAWVKNVPWGLKPGTWFYSGSEQRIYYWSPNGSAPADDRFAASNGMLEYFRIEGSGEPVQRLAFKGMTFTRGARNTWTNNYIPNRWQHSWEGYDEAGALLRFRGAEDCRIEKCRFVNSGATGVRLDLHCQDIVVADSEFGHLGGSGVVLSGYGPGHPDVNFGNMIENNWFHHGGESYWHSPAVFVVQSGNNYIARNLIHNYPYNGLVISGIRRFIARSSWESQNLINWEGLGYSAEPAAGTTIDFPGTRPYLYASNNIVTGNEIFRVMDGNMGDGNAVYVSGAGDGNLVSYNYIHDLRGDAASAMRTDDAQWGVLLEKNVIYRSTGLGILIKGDNSAVNNYIINQQGCFFTSYSNTVYLSVRMGPNTNTVVEKNMYVQMDGSQHPGFYEFKSIDPQKPVQMDQMTVNSNLYWWQGNQSDVGAYINSVRSEYGFDTTCRNNDPGFVDWQNGDFRLTNSAPAALGIESLDVRQSGLIEPFRSEVYRAPSGTVAITPESGVFVGATNVTLSAPSDLEIRYTLDGSEPTDDSTLYTGTFQVTNPVVIRAKQFGEGFVDRLDARTILYPWTPPVVETFELDAGGVSRSRMRLLNDTDGTVTNTVAPGTGHGYAIRLNGQGGTYGWNPQASYQFTHAGGQVEVKFDLWLNSTNLDFRVQGRDNVVQATNDVNYVGPSIHIDNGWLVYNGSETLTSIPTNQWVEITLVLSLGSAASDYTVKVKKPLQTEEVFPHIPFRQTEFREFNLLGLFISGSSSVYMDNLSVQKL